MCARYVRDDEVWLTVEKLAVMIEKGSERLRLTF
jgi:hypothetical protein